MSEVCPDLSHLKEEVKEVVRETDRSGKEVALQVCDVGGDLVPGDISLGSSKYRVAIDSMCSVGDLKGVIHTHPGGVAVPSDMDVETAVDKEWDFVCVADDEGDNLGCFCFD